jgi:hypothetical protein
VRYDDFELHGSKLSGVADREGLRPGVPDGGEDASVLRVAVIAASSRMLTVPFANGCS